MKSWCCEKGRIHSSYYKKARNIDILQTRGSTLCKSLTRTLLCYNKEQIALIFQFSLFILFYLQIIVYYWKYFNPVTRHFAIRQDGINVNHLGARNEENNKSESFFGEIPSVFFFYWAPILHFPFFSVDLQHSLPRYLIVRVWPQSDHWPFCYLYLSWHCRRGASNDAYV